MEYTMEIAQGKEAPLVGETNPDPNPNPNPNPNRRP